MGLGHLNPGLLPPRGSISLMREKRSAIDDGVSWDKLLIAIGVGWKLNDAIGIKRENVFAAGEAIKYALSTQKLEKTAGEKSVESNRQDFLMVDIMFFDGERKRERDTKRFRMCWVEDVRGR